MNTCSRNLCSLILFSLLVSASPIWALWVPDGIPVSTEIHYQHNPQIISDDAGNSIIAWDDFRNGDYDIFAQRIDASGTVQWNINGSALCMETGQQRFVQMTSDGAGGAIVTWGDYRSGDDDIYAQRVDASGAVLWTTNGVSICSVTGNQFNPAITSDGSAGAIVTWFDNRNNDYQFDIYAQKVDASGMIQWTSAGVPLCLAAGAQNFPRIISDGTGGAIVTWTDNRSGYDDIYTQRIDSTGTVRWPANGISLCTAFENQSDPRIIADGIGGAIVTWEDGRNGYSDIYAQRIDSLGVVQWTTDGVPLSTASESQSDPRIISDGAGGAIVTWTDGRSGDNNIYAQRIDSSGTIQWTSDGMPICLATKSQDNPAITSDGAGGAIVTWTDGRYGVGYENIYIQRINAVGAVKWNADGVSLCSALGIQGYPQIAADGIGGAVVAWEDDRDAQNDIYAQQIDSQGRIIYYSPIINTVKDVPGDEGGRVNLTWYASLSDYLFGEITGYTVWRAIDASATSGTIPNDALIVTSPSAALEKTVADSETPILRLDTLQGKMFFWELVSTQTAYRLQGYASAVPTLFDSTAVCADYHYFQVIAHTFDPSTYYVSEPDSGYSIDNLSPRTPLAFTGIQVYLPAGLALTWDPNSEPDLRCYRIYRGIDESFVPAAGNRLTEAEDPEYLDDTWTGGSGYFYKLSAVDIHGNESGFTLLGPDIIAGVYPVDTPAATSLSQNFPNPFNPKTSITYSIAEPGNVRLDVYDASGRLVKTLINTHMSAGAGAAEWNGTDTTGKRVASGTYFLRLETEQGVMTRKVMLAK